MDFYALKANSLVQEIVKLHRGEIDLESERSKGTTFTVKLPKHQLS
jgi:signal transduction histidine kinase